MPDRGAIPHMMSPDELKEVVRQALREEFELVGIDASDPDKRAAIRKDHEFMRRMREGMDGAAKKVGYAVLTATVGGFLALLVAGAQVKLGR